MNDAGAFFKASVSLYSKGLQFFNIVCFQGY
jgi:hypothetical protein